MQVRDIEEDDEARLEPVKRAGLFKKSPRGKVEREGYRSGEEELEAKFGKLDLPDGAELEVLVNDHVVGTATIGGGRGKVRLVSTEGLTVPAVAAEDIVEVRHQGEVRLRGEFYVD